MSDVKWSWPGDFFGFIVLRASRTSSSVKCGLLGVFSGVLAVILIRACSIVESGVSSGKNLLRRAVAVSLVSLV